jgi:phosphoglycolate phosphatase-like HAD superfamily hydrolase
MKYLRTLTIQEPLTKGRIMIRAIAFDFDGVLVESVDVKTHAYTHLFEEEESEKIEKIRKYHLENGGISRFEKFRYIYKNILRRSLSDEEFHSFCERFSRLVVDEVIASPWVAGAREFLQEYKKEYIFFIISGTPHEELTDIVRSRGMERYFKETLGSPGSKEKLLSDVMQRHALDPKQLVFVGDAETDWNAAQKTKVSFIWRRTSENVPQLKGFSGASISSLLQLPDSLSHLCSGVKSH